MKCKNLSELYKKLCAEHNQLSIDLMRADFDILALKSDLVKLLETRDSILNIVDDPYLFLLRRRLSAELRYSFIDEFKNGYARAVRGGGIWNFIGKDGRLLNEDSFSECRSFSDGLAAVRLSGESQWSFLTENGNYLGDPRFIFQSVGDFHDGIAWATSPLRSSWENQGRFYIDKKGNRLTDKKYHSCDNFKNEFGRIQRDDFSYGFIKKDGSELSDHHYKECRDWVNGFSCVQNSDREGTWNFLKKDGSELNTFKYKSCQDFQEGLAVVQFPDGSYNFVKEDGSHLNSVNYKSATDFVYGFAIIQKYDGSWNFLKKDGTELSKSTDVIKNCRAFHGGFGRVYSYDKKNIYCNFVDEAGDMLFDGDKKYKECSFFSDGFARVQRMDGSWNFVDKSGAELNTEKYAECRDFHNGIACARLSRGGWFFINENGEKLFNGASFGGVSDFYKNHAFVKNLDSSSHERLSWKILYRDGSFSKDAYELFENIELDANTKIFLVKCCDGFFQLVNEDGFVCSGRFEKLEKTEFSLLFGQSRDDSNLYYMDKNGRFIFGVYKNGGGSIYGLL